MYSVKLANVGLLDREWTAFLVDLKVTRFGVCDDDDDWNNLLFLLL
jgi:hypothetical protein